MRFQRVVNAIVGATATLALGGCATADRATGSAGLGETDAATMRVCVAALALEHNLAVEFDWNTAWESAANMELELELAHEPVRSAARSVSTTVPALLDDESLSDDDFAEAVVPVLSELYGACEDWAAERLYDE